MEGNRPKIKQPELRYFMLSTLLITTGFFVCGYAVWLIAPIIGFFPTFLLVFGLGFVA